MKSIDKYLKQVNLIDLYITKNICQIIKDKNELEFIKSNIFLLGFVNKNKKNSLTILLENSEYEIIKKLIKYEPDILNYKNKSEVNLFQLIIIKEEFYDLVLEILEKYNYDLVLKIITNKDINGMVSVDLLISIINVNSSNFIKIINKIDEYQPYLKIKKIFKMIYNLGREDLTLLITKLCGLLTNSQILLNILEYINPINIDIYPDKTLLTCVDYLLITENYTILKYLVPRINYIYFINTENNFLFNFIDNSNKYDNLNKEHFISLIFEILSKSNISKIKNIKNENIFYNIVENYKLNPNVIKDLIKSINIYEENINGKSIYDIIKIKYHKLKIKDKKEKIYLLEFKQLLEPTDIGIFGSDILHNMIYTTIILSKYKDILIPNYFQSKEYNNEQSKLLSISNNQKYIISYIKLYFNYFNPWIPFIIIWKNKNNYYLDENLLKSILENKKTKYIYIRLSLSMIEGESEENTRHANVILIDNVNKIVERFEPYGEINYSNSQDINIMITKRIAEPLDYEFKFIQPYPGFQSRSDEFNKFNKVYGDPVGFCLAWCLLYIETKMLLDQDNNKNIITNPIESINNYIIQKFKKDFPNLEKDNQSNLYMIFIRYYGKKLDSEKNSLLKKLDIEPAILYNSDITQEKYKNILKKINFELSKYYNKNKIL